MNKTFKLLVNVLIILLISLKSNCQSSELAFSTLTQNPEKSIPPTNKSRNGGRTSVFFVGSGDIQKSYSEGAGITANTGVGVIFKRTWDKDDLIQDMVFDLNINIASTADTIIGQFDNQILKNRREFGNYLLIPVNSKQSANFDFNLFFGGYDSFFWSSLISGLNFRLNASNSTWQFNDKVVNLAGISTRLGLFHEFMPDNIRHDEKLDYSIKVGAAYSFRGLYGDLSSKANTSLRNEFLGTDKTKFRGIEFLLGFRLKNLSAELQIPMLKNKSSEIPGLTNTQFVTSIRFIGGFSLLLEKKDDDSVAK